jgi:hypothetical protein
MTRSSSDVAGAQAKARVAGICYLAMVLGGVFAQAAVFQRFQIGGDPAATIGLIEANAAWWRVGLTVNLLYLLGNVPVATILYGFFRGRFPVAALCGLGFVAVTAAMEGLSLSLLYVPLLVSENAASLASFSGFQGQGLSYLALRLHPIGFGFALVFFAGFCMLTGALIIRSRLVPRVIGMMMIVAGGCYAANTMLMLLAPDQWRLVSPQILVPCLLAELSLAIWLLVRGVNVGSEGGREEHSAAVRHAAYAK